MRDVPESSPTKPGMDTTKNLVIGSGPTGTLTAELLAEAGVPVTLVSRRGGNSTHPRIRHVSLDARDAVALTALASGASVIFNCAMPAYDRWPQEFPPLAEAVSTATVRSGASLVTLSNVYGYGAAPGPLVESLPMAPTTVKGKVRAKMWQDALDSGARVCEVRASDFLGHGAASLFTLLALPRILRGEALSYPGDLAAAHSWSFTRDVALTLVRAAGQASSWGRAWHVPSNTVSVQALSAQFAKLAAAPQPALSRMTHTELQHLADVDTIMREVVEMVYLFERPSVLDSTLTERTLGVRASALEEVLCDTLIE